MSHLRRAITSLLLAGAVVSCRPQGMPATDLNAEADLIRRRSQQLVEAEGRKELEAILPFYAEDAVNQPPGAPAVQGHQAIREFYMSFYREVPLVSFTSTVTALHVAQGGDLAYETGANHLVLDKGGTRVEDVGKYLAVWRKINGEWRVAAVSFSSDRPTP